MTLKAYANNSVIKYHAKKYKLSVADTEILFLQLKAYLYECSLTKESLSPSVAVDELWHTFIVHTEEYTKFCNTFFGKYMHHRPSVTGKPAKMDMLADCRNVINPKAIVADCYNGTEMKLADCDNVDVARSEVIADCDKGTEEGELDHRQ